MTDFYSAKHWAEKARKHATGTSTENPDGSAKYWAERAEAAAETTAIPLPSAADAGKFLMTNGEESSWETVEEQTQSDWNETTTTAKSYIKNKPNFATVATSGSYNDLTDKPDIPADVITISSTSGTVTLQTNKVYKMSITGSGITIVSFMLPYDVLPDKHNQIKIFASLSGNVSIAWGVPYYFNNTIPEIEEGNYEFYFDYDPNLSDWVVGVLPIGTGA